jgi:hypothetical protein
MRKVRAFLRRHGFHPVEALLLVLGALASVYKLLTLVAPVPTLPPGLYLPALTVILAGLYLTEKWRSRTGKPALRMDSTVEKDQAFGCFRLRLWNDRGPVCKPRVRVESVVNDHGRQLVQALPLELEWTHHPEGPAALGPGDVGGDTVAIALHSPWPWQAGTPARVYLYGHKNRLEIGSVRDFVGGWFEVTVSAYSPDYNTDRIERRFRFYYDENEAPMFFRPELVA